GYADADGDPFTISSNFDFFQTTEVTNVYGKINWDVGQFTITSVTDYQDIEHSYGEDADASPTDAFNYTQVVEIEQISQEIRVNWEGERHRSVVGFYYLNIDGEYSFDQSGAVFFGPATFNTSAVQETTTFAFFGQTEFDINEQVSVTLGLRYNNDDKDYTLMAPDFGFATFTDTFEEEDFSVKAQLDFRPNDDWLVYASYSRGIKSGGFNLPLTPLAASDLPFEGETLNAFEVGFKANLTDNTRLNASAYYYDYSDYQAYNIDAFFNTLLFNANAEYRGAEIELFSNPVDGLDIILGASFIDTEVTDLPLDFNTLDPITFAPAQAFPTGEEEAPLAPSVTVNGLARYSWPAFRGNLAIQGDFRFVDEQKFNLSTSESVLEDSYFLLNARLEYSTANDAWTAAVFVNNLTDEEYRTFGIDGTLFFGSSEDVPGLERWVGGSVAYRW
ncbi:MAG: TonB-dependent receptor, partial [Gammaproteobacteria bacterium]|nr:TonB-dependent receptor [Gammaproteobacteria bacterium]